MTRMKVLRNILAVVVGLRVGGGVNMALAIASPHVIPPPAGVDVSDPQSLSASMHLFEPKHFVFPFLAHALGTLAGALVAFLVAASHRPVLWDCATGEKSEPLTRQVVGSAQFSPDGKLLLLACSATARKAARSPRAGQAGSPGRRAPSRPRRKPGRCRPRPRAETSSTTRA